MGLEATCRERHGAPVGAADWGAEGGADDIQRDFATASLPCAGRVLGARLACGGTLVIGVALAWSEGSQYMLRSIALGGGSARQDKSKLGTPGGSPRDPC